MADLEVLQVVKQEGAFRTASLGMVTNVKTLSCMSKIDSHPLSSNLQSICLFAWLAETHDFLKGVSKPKPCSWLLTKRPFQREKTLESKRFRASKDVRWGWPGNTFSCSSFDLDVLEYLYPARHNQTIETLSRLGTPRIYLNHLLGIGQDFLTHREWRGCLDGREDAWTTLKRRCCEMTCPEQRLANTWCENRACCCRGLTLWHQRRTLPKPVLLVVATLLHQARSEGAHRAPSCRNSRIVLPFRHITSSWFAHALGAQTEVKLDEDLNM